MLSGRVVPPSGEHAADAEGGHRLLSVELVVDENNAAGIRAKVAAEMADVLTFVDAGFLLLN